MIKSHRMYLFVSLLVVLQLQLCVFFPSQRMYWVRLGRLKRFGSTRGPLASSKSNRPHHHTYTCLTITTPPPAPRTVGRPWAPVCHPTLCITILKTCHLSTHKATLVAEVCTRYIHTYIHTPLPFLKTRIIFFQK